MTKPHTSPAPRRVLDLKAPVFDAGAVARANDALKAMSGSFKQWLADDVARMQDFRQAGEGSGWQAGDFEGLFALAHDLKGMGGTYDYPLVTQLAASLCRLIETDAGKAAARTEPALIGAHVDALRAAVRGQIQTDAHPIGGALLRTLEARVEALGVAPR